MILIKNSSSTKITLNDMEVQITYDYISKDEEWFLM
jgi:hypothetical protein